MTEPTPTGASSPTRSRLRDLRGRGMRGPAFAPGGLVDRVPARRTPREHFDRVVLGIVEDVESRWPEQLRIVELAVEETPIVPASWSAPRVPLASLVPGTATSPPRLVLFRRPIERRCDSPTHLEAMVLTVVVEQLAGYLGVRPEDVHPDYDADDE